MTEKEKKKPKKEAADKKKAAEKAETKPVKKEEKHDKPTKHDKPAKHEGKAKEKGSGKGKKLAAEFDEADWFAQLQRALRMNELVITHSEIMEEYDPETDTWTKKADMAKASMRRQLDESLL